MRTWRIFAAVAGLVAARAARRETTPLADPARWESFDLARLGDRYGYGASVFDGRHVYYGPLTMEGRTHAGILRFDTAGLFDEPSSWDLFDASAVTGEDGCFGGLACDGRFVYFAPFRKGQVASLDSASVALRYRIGADFAQPSSWERFDLAALDRNSGGYFGAEFDGRHVYFAPYYSGSGSIFVRFDTARAFTDRAAWDVYDSSRRDIRLKGYVGARFDGRHVYFTPSYNTALSRTATVVLRYDTTMAFDADAAWQSQDLTELDGRPGGLHGAEFDGRYLYCVPFYSRDQGSVATMHHGLFTRFDATKALNDRTAWSVFDLRRLGEEVCGFVGSGFDGVFVYLSPGRCNRAETHGLMLRYDTRKPFDDDASYQIFDARTLNPRFVYYDGAVAFDGSHLYFNPGGPQRMMLRFRSDVPDDARRRATRVRQAP